VQREWDGVVRGEDAGNRILWIAGRDGVRIVEMR